MPQSAPLLWLPLFLISTLLLMSIMGTMQND